MARATMPIARPPRSLIVGSRLFALDRVPRTRHRPHRLCDIAGGWSTSHHPHCHKKRVTGISCSSRRRANDPRGKQLHV